MSILFILIFSLTLVPFSVLSGCINILTSHPVVPLISLSTENGEKADKELEAEVKEEEPEVKEKVKPKTKKDKKSEEGFELWNELEIQRIKFMVNDLFLVASYWMSGFLVFSYWMRTVNSI